MLRRGRQAANADRAIALEIAVDGPGEHQHQRRSQRGRQLSVRTGAHVGEHRVPQVAGSRAGQVIGDVDRESALSTAAPVKRASDCRSV